MLERFNKIKEDFLKEVREVSHSQALLDLEKKFLGRKSEFTLLMKEISNLDEEEKRRIGQALNSIKEEIKLKIGEIRETITGKESIVDNDVSLPGPKEERGHLHPITQIQYELEDVFTSLGFMVLDGPELESDFYNFEGLNIPASHPARDMQDTFYVENPFAGEKKGADLVMRTHTSPVQVRAMLKYGAPLRAVVPGRVFRAEATDAVHEHTFDQMEGIMIGENISMSNLITVMKELLKGVFKKEMKVRVRPGYFPFVEPGIELDIACTICGGAKCPACKHSGWLEILPAGMVHPNVLRAGGIDPAKYSGFAFGLGLTRMAMMRYGIDDIRLFNSGDLRFVKQF